MRNTAHALDFDSLEPAPAPSLELLPPLCKCGEAYAAEGKEGLCLDCGEEVEALAEWSCPCCTPWEPCEMATEEIEAEARRDRWHEDHLPDSLIYACEAPYGGACR